MKTIKCEGYSHITDCGYEFSCGYNTGIGCGDCILSGGQLDPRFAEDNQPKYLSTVAIRSALYNWSKTNLTLLERIRLIFVVLFWRNAKTSDKTEVDSVPGIKNG